MPGPKLLIEQWLPIEAIGAECMRERGASSALPPLYFMHVWWARRPLTVSRAAILASLLPAYPTEDDPDALRWPDRFQSLFPTFESYKAWFLRTIGIHGDPVSARKLIGYEKMTGRKTASNKYGYRRAFTYELDEEQVEVLFDLIEWVWGTREISFHDPMAGGGSIPFEALRLGLAVKANELNSVASVVLAATLDFPARYGPLFSRVIQKYGTLWSDKVRSRLKVYFPEHPPTPDGSLRGGIHLWARTVACPGTGKPVPLSPNWWLRKGSDPSAVRLMAHPTQQRCCFEIVRGKTACSRIDPDRGTVRLGTAVSPWTGETIDGDYIKKEAQAGRMNEQLYAIEIYDGTSSFREATREDEELFEKACGDAKRLWPLWESKGLIPVEPRREGRADWACEIYGARRWCDTYSLRQIMSMITYVESLHEIMQQAANELDESHLKALKTYLAFAVSKAAAHNSKQSWWEGSRLKVVNASARHDLGMKWSYSEFDSSRNLLPWSIDQVVDSFRALAKLSHQEKPHVCNRISVR